MSDTSRISVLEHLTALMDARFTSIEKELRLYREDMSRRLEGLNELREEYTKSRSRDQELLLPRSVFDAWTKGRAEWRDTVEQRLTTHGAKADKSSIVAVVAGVLSIFATIIAVILHLYVGK
jgi:hypothetical protein